MTGRQTHDECSRERRVVRRQHPYLRLHLDVAAEEPQSPRGGGIGREGEAVGEVGVQRGDIRGIRARDFRQEKRVFVEARNLERVREGALYSGGQRGDLTTCVSAGEREV